MEVSFEARAGSGAKRRRDVKDLIEANKHKQGIGRGAVSRFKTTVVEVITGCSLAGLGGG